METALIPLTEIDYVYVIAALLTIIGGCRAALTLLEWLARKSGLEFSWLRRRREQETLIKTSLEKISAEQRELLQTVREIAAKNIIRDECTIEEMCDRISQKTRDYIHTLHGIPEDEYDDFIRLFECYRKLGGNHGAQAKFDYCVKNLPILPVETRKTTNLEVLESCGPISK